MNPDPTKTNMQYFATIAYELLKLAKPTRKF